MCITELDKKYEFYEIVKGDSIFCATAITDTMNMRGVALQDNHYFTTETLVTHKTSKNNHLSIEKRKITFDNVKN